MIVEAGESRTHPAEAVGDTGQQEDGPRPYRGLEMTREDGGQGADDAVHGHDPGLLVTGQPEAHPGGAVSDQLGRGHGGVAAGHPVTQLQHVHRADRQHLPHQPAPAPACPPGDLASLTGLSLPNLRHHGLRLTVYMITELTISHLHVVTTQITERYGILILIYFTTRTVTSD